MTQKFRELRLTSPHMRGHDVEVAQHRLHHNRYGEFYKPTHTDGVYGPETGAAAKHAKYALGFPDRQLDQHYDAALDARLSGSRPLGPAFAKRRKARTAYKGNIKSKAADLALKQVGYHESGVNNSKFGAWYGINPGAWCAMFVTWCEVMAGDKVAFARGSRYAYVPSIYTDALHGNHGMSFTSHPERGDLALFYFSGGERPANHVGIVLDANPWRWISGNFSDQVEVSTANRSNVARFVRLPR